MSDFLDWSTLIYRAPALLIAMALHEYAHAYVSDSLGDPTPSMQGRLTANPLVHLDMVGLMLLVICGFGWAKPVEINPNYYKNFRSGVMKVSFAGPGMNLLICFLAECIMLLMMKLGLLTAGQPGYLFLYWIMLYNVWFAFFNSRAAAGRLQNFGNGASRQIGFCIPQFQLPLQFPSFTVPGFQRHDRTDY